MSQPKPSAHCRDYQHHRCDDCGCRCHTDERLFTDTAIYGAQHTIGPLYSRDLLAHLQSGGPLRGGITLDQAAQAVRTVIDLGWRPTVAQLLREGEPAVRTDVAEPPRSETVETVNVQEALL